MRATLGPGTFTSLWRLLGAFLGRQRRRVLLQPALGMIIAVCEAIALLGLVRMMLLVVDGGSQTDVAFLGSTRTVSFGALLLLAGGACVTSAIVRTAESHITATTSALAVQNARKAVLESWFAADWEQVRQTRLGRLQQMLGINAQNAAVPVQVMAIGSVAVISLAIYGVVLLTIAPVIAGLFGVLAGVTAGLFSPLRRRTRAFARNHAAGLGELQLQATSYAALNRELHVLGVSGEAAKALKERSAKVCQTFRSLRYMQRLTPSLYQQSLLGGVIVVVALGRALDVDAAGFGTAAIVAVRSLGYLQQLNAITQTYVEARPYLEELEATALHQRQMRRERGDDTLAPVESLDLTAVRFEYEEGTPVLDDLSLHIRKGERIGIVGPSGGGKTTLLNIIAGLLSPTEGEYQVNTAFARRYTAESWARQFGLVSQEPILLRATVAENIAFHRSASMDEIRRAARLAAIEPEIDALPNGFDTAVGDGNATLSGGQRQRIAFARALLRLPSCLVLDEPTSALDAANERLIDGSLANLPEGTTIIVASHRRRLLEQCSYFYVINDGRISAEGTRDQVDLDRLIGEPVQDPERLGPEPAIGRE